MALIGMAPERSVLAWGVLAACGFLGQLGPILQLPDMVLRISPFANVPKFPGADLDIVPLVVLTTIALVLTAFGVNGFRQRDIG
ncbi:MAG TPA: polyketide antibiotic transporter, partial [Dermatophilaceae bacterium]